MKMRFRTVYVAVREVFAILELSWQLLQWMIRVCHKSSLLGSSFFTTRQQHWQDTCHGSMVHGREVLSPGSFSTRILIAHAPTSYAQHFGLRTWLLNLYANPSFFKKQKMSVHVHLHNTIAVLILTIGKWSQYSMSSLIFTLLAFYSVPLHLYC